MQDQRIEVSAVREIAAAYMQEHQRAEAYKELVARMQDEIETLQMRNDVLELSFGKM